MIHLSLERKRKIIRYTTVIGIIITIIGSIIIGRSAYFRPGGGFATLLIELGPMAPLLFVLVQISQIVYPIIPLGLTNVIGDLIFGHLWGFIFNAIGMIIGSAINFYLGRRFGSAIIKAFISDEKFYSYLSLLRDRKRFIKITALGFIAPLFPDDVFCMIAGMSPMRFREFMTLVILCRPISMFVYTFMTSTGIQWIYQYFNS